MAHQSLHLLIQSIAGAVAEAQDKIQRFQISSVREYFDDDNRPVCIDMRLPSVAADAMQGEERVVRVPLLALVGPRLLAVKDMEIGFDVGLAAGPVARHATVAEDDHAGAWPHEPHAVLNVDLGVRRNGEGTPLAHVTLRVETQPCSEGMARLLQNLNQYL